MIPLTIIADSTGAWFAAGFILLFVIKAVLSVFGGDLETEFDSDGDVDIDVNADGFGFSASDFFSLKGFLNFGVGFCSSWALFGLTGWYAALAVAIGFVTMFLLLYVYRACMKLDSGITVEKPIDLLYRIGTVYTVTDGAVLLQMSVNGRIDELMTVPDADVNISDFKVGDLAYISKVDAPTETSVRFYSKPYNKNTEADSTLGSDSNEAAE